MLNSLFEALRKNDKHTFLQILKEYSQNPPNLSIDDPEWADLYVTAVSNSQCEECLELLIEYGDGKFFNKDDRIRDEKTALHFACENGCDENVLVLLRRGCNPDQKTKQGETALHIASSKGHSKIVEYLLNYAANINERNEDRRTPLHLAVMSSQVEMSRLLLEKGANTRLSDCNGCLPLLMAYYYYHPKYFIMARPLLEHDLTTINSQDYEGRTPLMHALHQNESNEHIHYLLENGAKVEFCDRYGETTLHYATKIKNNEILSLILQSVDTEWIEECFKHSPNQIIKGCPLNSLMSNIIDSFDFESLASLLASRLPKSILQVPIRYKNPYSPHTIHTPLTYLFYNFCISKEKEFNICLQLLLKHKITTLDEYNKIIQVKWPKQSIFFSSYEFSHPFSYLFYQSHFASRQSHFLNILEKNDISVDYCLRCYHDNTRPYTSCIDTYWHCYLPVIKAVGRGNMEALKLMLSRSVILEPDKLLTDHLFNRNNTKMIFDSAGAYTFRTEFDEKSYDIYQYLISLKPLYYKQWHPKFDNFIYFPGIGWDRADNWKAIWKEESGFSSNKQFSKVTLQQLCRTAIRQQLRGPTFEANLQNFRRNILELPLPNLLKDYLLFKY